MNWAKSDAAMDRARFLQRVPPLHRFLICLAAASAAAMSLRATPVPAAPTPQASPDSSSTAEPTAIPATAHVLPLDSSLLFVLDDRIGSHVSQSGTEARAHLKDALTLGGVTVAPAGTPARIKITDVHGAQAPDVDGTIDILFEPIRLANNSTLPLRTPTAHVTVHVTAGQESTASLADEIKDIFIPYHVLYRMFRKGAEVDLRPGTVLRARTAAVISVTRGMVSVVAPPPLHLSVDQPHSHFSPLPFVTVPPKPTPTPRPRPQATPPQ
ncbi:MAG: hypothetical protein JO018_00140 [Candidatus Eremiobacteraeota bacterium]|nr:hypothetical protein [Candidatus Eremiobacteraeota bacterium]